MFMDIYVNKCNKFSHKVKDSGIDADWCRWLHCTFAK